MEFVAAELEIFRKIVRQVSSNYARELDCNCHTRPIDADCKSEQLGGHLCDAFQLVCTKSGGTHSRTCPGQTRWFAYYPKLNLMIIMVGSVVVFDAFALAHHCRSLRTNRINILLARSIRESNSIALATHESFLPLLSQKLLRRTSSRCLVCRRTKRKLHGKWIRSWH